MRSLLPPSTAPARLRWLGQVLLIASLYYLGGQASFALAVSNGIVSPVIFAAEGFALAFCLWWGPQVWPGVFLGQLLLALGNGLFWPLALAVSFSNSAEAVLGAVLFQRWALQPQLQRMRDLLGLLALIVLVLQPFSASVGHAILWVGGLVKPVDLLHSWLFWWSGNVMGQILVTPMVLSGLGLWRSGHPKGKPMLAAVLVGGVTLLLLTQAQTSGMAAAFALLSPLLILIAAYEGLAAVTLACFVMAGLVLYLTLQHQGPFMVAGQVLALDLNVFLLGASLTGQFVAVLFSERQLAAQALNDSETKFHTLYSSTPDAVLLLNAQGLVECNPAATRMLGLPPGPALTGLSWLALSPPQQEDGSSSATRFAQYQQHALAGTSQRFEWQFQRRDQETRFPAEVLLHPMTFQGQTLLQATVRDISERRQVAQMKEAFVATVSHELRTPLTSINGALSLLLGGSLGPVPDTQQPLLELAQRNGQRLALLVNDLLDMEKLVAGKMNFCLQNQALLPLLHQAMANNRPYADRFAVTYQLEAEPSSPWVHTDAERLQQVLSNLLSNAAKFSPEGGTVRLAIARHPPWVRVLVQDDGPGIALDFQPLIFQKFAQAQDHHIRRHGGTGLGLAISRELMAGMGGDIGFTSQPGHGACFYIDLPEAAQP